MKFYRLCQVLRNQLAEICWVSPFHCFRNKLFGCPWHAKRNFETIIAILQTPLNRKMVNEWQFFVKTWQIVGPVQTCQTP